MMKLVLTTFAGSDEAARVIRTLVEEKLAACGTIHAGARSIYAWKEAIEDVTEIPVTLKIPSEKFAALEARLRELHSYETPEILAIDPSAISEAYEKWVEESCQP